jgi:ribosomal peptide maturation radical SAM protein 1
MEFRSKSPERVAEELAVLARRHRTFRFDAVDNILDARYLTTVLPAIARSEADYDLFYEVKANLTRAQLKQLAEAGVRRIQPGLESLDSGVLGLMNKGVRASQNVNLLRWAAYYGISVSWNIIWGFPGETRAEYDRMAAAIPDLVHLTPPEGAGRVWLERFSPLFSQPGTYAIKDRRPEASYRYVYPAALDLERIAYFFEYEFTDALPDDAYSGVQDAVAAWSEAWSPAPPRLVSWSAPGFVQIYDGRHPGRERTCSFDGVHALIYRAINDRARSAAAIGRSLGIDATVEIEAVLAEFGALGLVFRDGPLALALAVPAVPGR